MHSGGFQRQGSSIAIKAITTREQGSRDQRSGRKRGEYTKRGRRKKGGQKQKAEELSWIAVEVGEFEAVISEKEKSEERRRTDRRVLKRAGKEIKEFGEKGPNGSTLEGDGEGESSS